MVRWCSSPMRMSRTRGDNLLPCSRQALSGCVKRSLLMNENFLAKLFEHNTWANQMIIEACLSLTDEQLDAPPQSATEGSIRSTLSHLVTSQRRILLNLTSSRRGTTNKSAPAVYRDLVKCPSSSMTLRQGTRTKLGPDDAPPHCAQHSARRF